MTLAQKRKAIVEKVAKPTYSWIGQDGDLDIKPHLTQALNDYTEEVKKMVEDHMEETKIIVHTATHSYIHNNEHAVGANKVLDKLLKELNK